MGWFMEVSLRSPKTPKALGPERISCQKPTIAWLKPWYFDVWEEGGRRKFWRSFSMSPKTWDRYPTPFCRMNSSFPASWDQHNVRRMLGKDIARQKPEWQNFPRIGGFDPMGCPLNVSIFPSPTETGRARSSQRYPKTCQEGRGLKGELVAS